MTWSALVVDDDPGVRQSIRLCLEVEGARVLGVGTPAAALEALDRAKFDVIFLDLWIGSESGLTVLPEILRKQPGVGVVVITAFASIETAVEAMRIGAADYFPKPFTPEQVRLTAKRVMSTRILQHQLAELQSRVDENQAEDFFETQSSSYRSFLDTAARAAASDAVVLLRGESGTGKNVMARWLRSHSKRRDQPFVTVHCPMLAGDLMTSALFGHRKGAFTGAVTDAAGKVEEAEHGTLFLDEVADLTPDAQSRLLRFLNDRTYERLGDTKERKADVRLITATNRPIEEDIKQGRFREDLFFRLNVISLTIPPLRERKEDLLPLAMHYLQFFALRQGRRGMSLSDECKRSVDGFHWPGNVRELRNAVERAVILAPTDVLESVDLGIPVTADSSVDPVADGGIATRQPPRDASVGGDYSLEEIEREHLARVIARLPSLDAAAKLLRIDPTTLQRKRKRYGLS
jgi:NtrC-family two-component system response regulator AlgB